MGELCQTKEDEAWESEIADTYEGIFGEIVEDEEGFFEGVFVPKDGVRERIRGKCDGTSIYFLRPADKPLYYYTGRFEKVGEEEKIFGSCTFLPLPEAKEERLRGEEWEGTKVPTLTPINPERAT